MCDHRHLRSPPPAGIVDHVSFLSDNLSDLVDNSDYSDITLMVENVAFPAHKVILATRSEYFRALLYGGMKESQPGTTQIELKDTSASAFGILLKYMYSGRLNLLEIKDENLLDILGMSHRYGFVDLESAISDYLKAILNISNVCLIYDIANMYHLTSLCQVCKEFIDKNAQEILVNETFFTLSQSSIKELISRDSFCAPENTIFNAVVKWTEHNQGQDPSPILECIRLPLMSMNDLLNVVRPTSLVSPDSILDAIKLQTESRDMDDKDYERVVDHSRYLCRSWQTLYFQPRVVRYVRVVGTHNTVNRVFHLVSFDCLFINKPFVLEQGLVVPSENVATIGAGACVIEGVSRSRNALINGDTRHYDWDSGYTCHQLGSGAIIVQLAQPYIIDSMRLLLWDCDDRSYSYYVEVSTDQKSWYLLADKRKEQCKSWQVIKFEKRPVTFVKIVGTHNTANEVFHCVHFECPAEMTNPSNNNSIPRSASPQPPGPSSSGLSHQPRPSMHQSHSSENYASAEYCPHEAPEADRQDSTSSHDESEN
uniref:BTB/POZ domain-containing protein 9 n=1 Tax=Magallana gigas TaxID=29159 RepID=A0A8W8HWW3_MAGGI